MFLLLFFFFILKIIVIMARSIFIRLLQWLLLPLLTPMADDRLTNHHIIFVLKTNNIILFVGLLFEGNFRRTAFDCVRQYSYGEHFQLRFMLGFMHGFMTIETDFIYISSSISFMFRWNLVHISFIFRLYFVYIWFTFAYWLAFCSHVTQANRTNRKCSTCNRNSVEIQLIPCQRFDGNIEKSLHMIFEWRGEPSSTILITVCINCWISQLPDFGVDISTGIRDLIPCPVHAFFNRFVKQRQFILWFCDVMWLLVDHVDLWPKVLRVFFFFLKVQWVSLSFNEFCRERIYSTMSIDINTM